MLPISIIIPIYNEEQILKKSLISITQQLKKHAIRSYEILLIDNGSTDQTNKLAHHLSRNNSSIHLITIPGPNFGNAVRHGLTFAKHENIYLFNIDLWNVRFIKQTLPLLTTFPIIVGSKQLVAALDRRPLLRRLGSRMLTKILALLFGFKGTDSHGIKVFKQSIVYPILSQCISNELLESELLVRAQKQGIRIKELPTPTRELRPARIRFFTRVFTVLYELIRLRVSLFTHPTHRVSINSITNPPRISCHADDVGLTKDNIDSTIKLIRAGAIKSISILANAPHTASACKMFRSFHGEIFLHFNIIEGLPVGDIDHIRSLVDKNGFFYNRPTLIKRTFLGLINPHDIATELNAQLTHLKKHGISVNGIDSHQHIHALSPYAEIVCGVAREKTFTIRSYDNMCSGSIRGSIKLMLLRTLALASHVVLYKSFRRPDSWNTREWKQFYVASWEHLLPCAVKNGAIIITHPGLPYDRL